MVYAVIARHLHGNRESECCQTESGEVAEKIAAMLRGETFMAREPNERVGRRVPRYQYVRVEEVKDGAREIEAPERAGGAAGAGVRP